MTYKKPSADSSKEEIALQVVANANNAALNNYHY